eukprot:TRINITY_DN4511_c0_g2_i2.p1 TRINITY_DN4511_c0_g2~~TRINITY_DN4511_c0_g2_i2.p1  ORF type:complete len:343 (+),score=24.80 TRINITY_DN4511_c0_g2_i2:143-1171(+)
MSQGKKDLKAGLCANISLEQYFERLYSLGYSRLLLQKIILPMISAICTCTYKQVNSMPADIIITYLTKHSFSLFGVGSGGRRIIGGSHAVVNRLTENLHHIRLDAKVSSIVPVHETRKVSIEETNGKVTEYDHVVLATPPHIALHLLKAAASKQQTKALSKFKYISTETVVHHDKSFMPPEPHQWSTINFVVNPEGDMPMSSVLINKLQPEARNFKKPIIMTWNPFVQPDESKVVYRVRLCRTILDLEAVKGLKLLDELQGKDNIYYCGSYAYYGVPLLESAVCSSMKISKLLGVTPPWKKGKKDKGLTVLWKFFNFMLIILAVIAYFFVDFLLALVTKLVD